MRTALVALDLMDTVVRDPFFREVPVRLQRTQDQVFGLLDSEAWIAFETGTIDEQTYLARMFNGPPPAEASAQELRDLIVGSYAFVDGMEQLLIELRQQGPRIWALSNYSPWVEKMRAELALDRFFEDYVVSYATGVRKPCPDAYRCLLRRSGVAAGDVLFVDDRAANVAAALGLGLHAVRFTDAAALRRELVSRGLLRGGE